MRGEDATLGDGGEVLLGRPLQRRSVEALLQGDEEDVKQVLKWSRIGPPNAEVSEVEEELLESCPRLDGFQITS